MSEADTRITGIGSLPGTDIEAAIRLVLDACPELVPFPELPARGVHAAMLGRGLALLDGLDAAYDAGEWRLSSTPGADLRRARQTWADDLDRFEEIAHGHEGAVKIGIAGPWTLAASVFRPRGGRVLADRGARRDLAQALGAGIAAARADWHRRFGREVVVQLDEPSLPAVVEGAVPTEGGYFRHRRVDRPELADLLRTVGGDVLHSCAGGVPLDLVTAEHGAGISAVALDADTLTAADREVLGQALERGVTVYLGCLPTSAGGPALPVEVLTRRVQALATDLGVAGGRSPRLMLTPACGLAGWEVRDVPAVFRALQETARRLDDGYR